jgi:cytoskeletal protein CcmA (bactofilin family)
VITKDANFQGEIKTKTISIEDGAYFKGNIELDKDQNKKTTDANKAKKAPTKEIKVANTNKTKKVSTKEIKTKPAIYRNDLINKAS